MSRRWAIAMLLPNLSYINLLATDDINASGKFMLEVLQVRIALNEHTVGTLFYSF